MPCVMPNDCDIPDNTLNAACCFELGPESPLFVSTRQLTGASFTIKNSSNMAGSVDSLNTPELYCAEDISPQ